jgi:hypothetical protein
MIKLPAKIGRATLRFATAADLTSLASEIDEAPSSEMVSWHLVNIEVGGVRQVHALGVVFGDAYVTSPLRGWDERRSIIRTRSGRVYKLDWRGDDGAMHLALVRHLLDALLAWRYASEKDISG